MAVLTLTGIKCFKQEDWTGDDDIQIVAYKPARSAVWRKAMDTGQTRKITGVTVDFTGSVKIQLIEKDIEGDDNLGTVTIGDAATAARDREARFTLDDANYTLWYRVSNPATKLVDHKDDAPHYCTKENPLLDLLKKVFGPLLEPFGVKGSGGHKQTCPLGSLAVRVRADGKPLEGAKALVRELSLTGLTNKDGVFDAGLVMEGDYTCEACKEAFAPNPGMTIGHVKRQTNNVVDVNLGKVKVAEVRPKGADLRQYINMPLDESKNYGKEHTIEAEITPKMKGVRVYFQLRYGKKNRTTPPTETKLTEYTALTDEKGVAKTKIQFGLYGGNWFRVGARLDKSEDPKVFSVWLQVWRKMFYEITEMKNPAGGSFTMAPGVMGIVSGAYAKVYIALTSLGKNLKQKADPTLVYTYVDNFDGGSGTDAWADKYCTTKGVPWKIHYAIVANADQKLTEDRVFKEIKVKAGQLKKQKSDGTWSNYWVKAWQFHGDNWLIKSQYREKGKAGWTNLPAAKVTLTDTTRKDGWRRIKVDFTGMAADPTKKTQEVKLKFRRRGGINGWGGTSLHLVICRNSFTYGYPGAKLKPAMAGTSIHEPGHSLTLVRGGKAWETSVAAHSSHCKFKQCVMWWQGYTGRPHDFHGPEKSDPGCHTFVRGKDLSKTAMLPRWKFPR